jgi:hypothetical protein
VAFAAETGEALAMVEHVVVVTLAAFVLLVMPGKGSSKG